RHTRFSRDWSSDVCSSDLTWTNDYLAVFLDLQTRFLYYSFLGIDRNGNPLEQDDVLTFFNPKIGLTYHVSPDAQWYISLAKGSQIGRASCRERGQISGGAG